MIKHIVCFKLNDSSEASKNEAKEVLMSMVGNVPTIKAIEVGTDFLCSPRSYDIILQVTLENREALEEYQNDAYHCDVVKKYMHAHTTASIAVDYDI